MGITPWVAAQVIWSVGCKIVRTDGVRCSLACGYATCVCVCVCVCLCVCVCVF